MDSVCENVNKDLESNQDLSMRLRNMEDILNRSLPGSTSAGAEQEVESDALDLSRASVCSASTISDHMQDARERFAELPNDNVLNQPRMSAFEEQLHRSRVYHHAAGSHSESSLLDDGRSTLALSICSSLTLGDVSTVSVYALPVYAVEISNPECYRFAQPTTKVGNRRTPSTPSETNRRGEQKEKIAQWRKKFIRSPAKQADRPVEEAGPRIFGVQFTTSIRYANVAISLSNDDGESYIYGYIPIILGKCAVKLKEEGV